MYQQFSANTENHVFTDKVKTVQTPYNELNKPNKSRQHIKLFQSLNFFSLLAPSDDKARSGLLGCLGKGNIDISFQEHLGGKSI